ncbi:MAG TPA: hypothetical protein VNJ54_15235 [Plantibacter sp.]|uniref:hypothetical protein n=1 Tax=Plantibacter sp. TaxID=1871045 RepID=UPI002D0482BF|nr:hypothetical protein [Plantibacter sp.]
MSDPNPWPKLMKPETVRGTPPGPPNPLERQRSIPVRGRVMLGENEQQLARLHARARNAEHAHMLAVRAAGRIREERDRYREALERCGEDAMWHLRGESGLPFDADTYACLRAIAETAHAALHAHVGPTQKEQR